jgi:hypothetical protein
VHPSPVRPPRTPANFEPLQPNYSPILGDPFSHSEQLHSVQITHFRFEIPSFREGAIWLPYNRGALDAFFEHLSTYDFHFYFFPDEERPLSRQGDRTLSHWECASHYMLFPFSTIRAVYCRGCLLHPIYSIGHAMTGQRGTRGVIADNVETLVEGAIELVQSAQAGAFEYNGI